MYFIAIIISDIKLNPIGLEGDDITRADEKRHFISEDLIRVQHPFGL